MLLTIIILLVALALLILMIRNKNTFNVTVSKLRAENSEKTAENEKLVKQIKTDKELLEAVQEDLTTAKAKYNELEEKIANAELDRVPEPLNEDAETPTKRETAVTVLYDGPVKKKQGKLVCSCCGGSVGGRGKVNYCSWCGAEIEFADEPKTQTFTE